MSHAKSPRPILRLAESTPLKAGLAQDVGVNKVAKKDDSCFFPLRLGVFACPASRDPVQRDPPSGIL